MLAQRMNSCGRAYWFWPTEIAFSKPSDINDYFLWDPRERDLSEAEEAHQNHADELIRSALAGESDRVLLVQSDHGRTNRRDQSGVLLTAPSEQLILYRRNDGTPPVDYPDEAWIYLAGGPAVAPDDIDLTIRRGMLYPPNLGFVTDAPKYVTFSHGRLLNESEARAMIDGVKLVYILAFDGQAFVFWSLDDAGLRQE